MLVAFLTRRLPNQKRILRSWYYRARQRIIDAFWSYGSEELVAAVRSLGVRAGDTLMVHAGFDRRSGYRESPSQFIDALLSVLGPQGNLIMVSMAYSSSAYDYLKQGKVFDVRKTVSHMGVISEAFRRRDGVLRSMHPSNPLLAYGPCAQWIVQGHEECLQPCGPGSPFERIAELRAKVLFYDASIFTQTFFHYLEDKVEPKLGFPLFRQELMEATVIDSAGNRRLLRTRVYSEEAIRRRRPKVMTDELDRRGLIRRARVGNSRLMLLRTEEVVRVVEDLAARNIFFYDG